MRGPSPAANSSPTPSGSSDEQDVGEEDRRVDAEALDRLQRDLGRRVRVLAELEEAEARAHRAVLRHVAARLPHEPDRRVRRGLAETRVEEAAGTAGGMLTRSLQAGLAQSRKRGYHPAARGVPHVLPRRQAGVPSDPEARRRRRDVRQSRHDGAAADGRARAGAGIRYVLALQEAVAISMADGYAQASGKLGVVNVHISPGLGNAMGMLYDAYKAGAPLLADRGPARSGLHGHRADPLVGSAAGGAPYVKWSHEITRLEDLPRVVRRAVKTALAHPTGPVFLSLPVDVLNTERDLDLHASTRVAPRIRGDRARDRGGRRAPRAGDAAHPDLGRRGRPRRRAGRDGRAGGAARRAGVHRGRRRPRAASRSRIRSTPARSRASGRPSAGSSCSTTCCSRSAATSSRSRCRPTWSRCRTGCTLIHLDVDPWEIGKNYPAQVGDPGRSEGDAARAGEALRRRLTATQAKDVAARVEKLRRRAGGAPRGAARRRRPPRRAAADLPARARPRGREGGARRGRRRRRGHLVEPRHPRPSSRLRRPRASSACAAAASAGACRRRSA